MESRGVKSVSSKPLPPLKSKSISSLKTKGDTIGNELRKGSHLNKNSPSVLRASTTSLNSGHAKLISKDSRSKTGSNHYEHHGGPSSVETKLELVDGAFNAHLTSRALNVLLEKSTLRCRGDVDKQIATLQKRVNDDLDVLEEARSRVSALYLLQEQSNLLNFHAEACLTCSDEPTFAKGKSFHELMDEVNQIKNQLPCKNILIPETNAEMAEFQAATTKLLHSLERISTEYGADQTPISQTATELSGIGSIKLNVEASRHSVDAIAQTATEGILNEAIWKTSKLKLDP